MSIQQISEAEVNSEYELILELAQMTASRDEYQREADALAMQLKTLRDSGVELPKPKAMGLHRYNFTESQLREYGDRRAMAERERAAKVCMDMNHGWCSDDAMACAEAIRKGE